MIYGFDVDGLDDELSTATAALVVYVVWRSRSRSFKITPTVWDQVHRFTKAAAKRAPNVPQFIEKLRPRLQCESLQPRWMVVGIRGVLPVGDSAGNTSYFESGSPDQREFMTRVLGRCDQRAVLDALYLETAATISVVRDRLERERPLEKLAPVLATMEIDGETT